MKLNLCTLFNSGYLSRGMALYRSLEKVCPDFHLYIFAFDSTCERYLREINLTHATIIGLSEFEDQELISVKSSRTTGEYCWTCTSSTILYSIEKFKLDHCTYVDADVQFYHDPQVLLNEAVNHDVMITDHWYSPAYDQSKESGQFCVQFVYFRNSENGMKVLRDWRSDCIAWCYNRVEDGKFGDQKYLDKWQSHYKGVHVMRNRSGGLAPWNLQQYELKTVDHELRVKHESETDWQPLVFFHFHGLKFFTGEMVQITTAIYDVATEWKEALFFPYVRALLREGQEISAKGAKFDPHGAGGSAPVGDWGLKVWLYYYLASVKESLGNIGGRAMKSRKRHHPFYSIHRFR